MLPRCEGERGDEKNYWTFWADWHAAGMTENVPFSYIYMGSLTLFLCT